MAVAVLGSLPALAIALYSLWTSELSTLARCLWSAAAIGPFAFMLVAITEPWRRTLRRLDNALRSARQDDAEVGAVNDDLLEGVLRQVDDICHLLEEQRLEREEHEAVRALLLDCVPAPVLAFDEHGRVIDSNRRARDRFALLDTQKPCTASDLGLDKLISGQHDGDGSIANDRALVRRVKSHGHLQHWLSLKEPAESHANKSSAVWQRLLRLYLHETNNSLMPIRSIATELLSRIEEGLSGDWEAEFSRFLETIERRTARLSEFLDRYGELARLPEAREQSVEVEGWLAGIVTLESRVPVTLVPGPHALAEVDAALLEQALINLVKNAAEAAASTDGTVSVAWTVSGRDLEIHIDDEGPGLNDAEKAFEPGFTTKDNGSGIGLALSRRIVEAHEGELVLVPNPLGRGARARVRLPGRIVSGKRSSARTRQQASA